MPRTTWIHRLASRLWANRPAGAAAARGRAAAAKGRHTARLAVEPLEDRCLMAAGALDPTFVAGGATPGKRTVPFLGTTDSETAAAVAVQKDGKIVMAGGYNFNEFAVVRLNADGTNDTTFGDNGRVVFQIKEGDNIGNGAAASLVIDPTSQKIYVAGNVRLTAPETALYRFAVARINPDGTLDTSFDTNGMAMVDFDTTSNAPPGTVSLTLASVVVQGDGKVVLSGNLSTPAGGDFALARLTTGGALDASFDTDGRVTVDFNNNSTDTDGAAAIAGDKIVVVGTTGALTQSGNTLAFVQSMAVVQLTSAGALDATFDADGKQTVTFPRQNPTPENPNNPFSGASAVAVQADGKIVVVGSTRLDAGTLSAPPNSDFAIARLNSDGKLDTSFGGGGRVVVAFDVGGPREDFADAVSIQADGKIVVAGSAITANTPAPPGAGFFFAPFDFAVVRLRTDGALDTSFDTDGRVTIAFDIGGARSDRNPALAIQANGRIVLAGVVTVNVTAASETTEMGVARLIGTASTATVGAFDPAAGRWLLRNANGPGGPDAGSFLFGAPGWVALTGDWNGDGKTSIGVVDPATMTFYLRNTNSAGAPDVKPFAFGAPGWVPVAGDWDGDGITTVGAFDPTTGTWYLTNTNQGGAPSFTPFAFGGAGWTPVVGDWNGDGKWTVGVVDPAGKWYLRNANSAGGPDVTPFAFGGAGWKPVAGDWDGDGDTNIGAFDPAGTWYLRFTNGAGAPDVAPFAYGLGSYTPVSGNWNFPAAPLRAAGAAKGGGQVAALDSGDLADTLAAAVDRLLASGLEPALAARLRAATAETGALPAGYLGAAFAAEGRVVVSEDGAGYGWFVDRTPAADEEFAGGAAVAGGAADGRMDLLTVVAHELGHLAGLDDDDGSALMGGKLAAGTRRA